jgi:hypothetical protein
MLTVRRGYDTWVTVTLNSPTAPGIAPGMNPIGKVYWPAAPGIPENTSANDVEPGKSPTQSPVNAAG